MPGLQNDARDEARRKIDASHLFGRSVTRIALRRGHDLRGFAYRFLEECADGCGAAAPARRGVTTPPRGVRSSPP